MLLKYHHHLELILLNFFSCFLKFFLQSNLSKIPENPVSIEKIMLIRVVRLVRVVKVIELVKVNKLVWVV